MPRPFFDLDDHRPRSVLLGIAPCVAGVAIVYSNPSRDFIHYVLARRWQIVMVIKWALPHPRDCDRQRQIRRHEPEGRAQVCPHGFFLTLLAPTRRAPMLTHILTRAESQAIDLKPHSALVLGPRALPCATSVSYRSGASSRSALLTVVSETPIDKLARRALLL